MIPVVVSGLGHCSALGQGADRLREAWREGKTPTPKPENIKTARGEVPVSVLRVPPITLPNLVPPAVERRMSHFAKMCLVTAAEAMADAGIVRPENPKRSGMVVGTAFGNLNLAMTYIRRILSDGPAGASPSTFAASIHNSIAAQLTLALEIRGPSSTVSTMEQTAMGSLRLAYDWIQSGAIDRAVVLMGDEISEYHLYYFAHLKTDWVPGEGMVAMILEREDLAKKAYARMGAPNLTAAQSAEKTFFAGAEKNTHSHLYGGSVMGVAVEMALATLTVERTNETIACVQTCRDLPPQSVIFSPPGI